MDALPLNIRHLAAFTATMRQGSISAAAQTVHISQPAITQGIASLEQKLGLSLFIRQPSGMIPTDAAALFAPRVDAALAFIQNKHVTMTQMSAFIALSEAGSYDAASRQLGISAPSVHRAVNDLAAVMKRELVLRRGRGIMMTDHGITLARRFRLALSELRAGMAELDALRGMGGGKISVGAMPLCRARLLPATVIRYHAAHPDIHIDIAEGSFGELIEPLRDGQLDLIIGAMRDPSPGPDVAQHFLFEDQPVILCRKDHPLVQHCPVSLFDLLRYNWVMPQQGTPLREIWRELFSTAGLPEPHVPIECGSVITIRQMLVESDCLSFLSPEQVAVELDAEWLSIVDCAVDFPTRAIGYTVREGWRPTTSQQNFIAVLQELVHDN